MLARRKRAETALITVAAECYLAGVSTRRMDKRVKTFGILTATPPSRAHEQFRWFGGGWAVSADLPTPAGFAAASQFVRPDDVVGSIACGPDLDELAESVRHYVDAGFTDVAVVQVGDAAQDRFVSEIAGPLLEKLRAL